MNHADMVSETCGKIFLIVQNQICEVRQQLNQGPQASDAVPTIVSAYASSNTRTKDANHDQTHAPASTLIRSILLSNCEFTANLRRLAGFSSSCLNSTSVVGAARCCCSSRLDPATLLPV